MTTATSATTATIRYPDHPVEIVDRHPAVHAVSDASGLGWVPGWWPRTVLFYDGDGAPVELTLRAGGDDVSDYADPDRTVLLVVYADDETSQHYCPSCRSTAAGSCPDCSFDDLDRLPDGALR